MPTKQALSLIVFLYGFCLIDIKCRSPHTNESERSLFNSQNLPFNSSLDSIIFPQDYAILNQKITLYVDFKSDLTVDIIICTTFFGWVGIGFGNGMKNVDMVIIGLHQNKTPAVTDHWSTGLSEPPTDISRGGSNDYNLVDYATNSTHIYVRVNRKLNTGDKYDTVLNKNNLSISYAWGEGSSEMKFHHQNYGIVDFNTSDNSWVSSLKKKEFISVMHIYGNFICWGILVDIGIISINFWKSKKMGHYIHYTALWITDVYTVVTSGMLLNLFSGSEGTVSILHYSFGLILILWIIFQHITGGILAVSTVFKISQKNIPILGLLNKFHNNSGPILYLFGKIQLILGVLRAWNTGFAIAYASVWIVFFSFTTSKKAKKYKVNDENKNHSPSQLIDIHNDGIMSVKKTYKDSVILFFENFIYEIHNFSHPGGDFMIEECKYQEISRYLYGVVRLPSFGKRRHLHALKAYQSLSTYCIGEILVPSNWNIFQSNSAEKEIWTLAQKKKLSSSTYLYYFVHQRLKVTNQMCGIAWIGRHLTLSLPSDQDKCRLYTTVICMTQENINYRKELLDIAKDALHDLKVQTQNTQTLSNYTAFGLPLIIKAYPGKYALSNQLSQLKDGENVFMKGPFGLGLEINEDFDGQMVLIVGGTGILPFLDLFDFLFRKALHLSVPTLDIQPKQNYSQILKKPFKMHFYGTFQELDDIVGYEWIIMIKKLSDKFNLDLIDIYLRVSKTEQPIDSCVTQVKERFEKNVLIKVLPPIECSKYYVCGPPDMMDSIPEALTSLGISSSKIIKF